MNSLYQLIRQATGRWILPSPPDTDSVRNPEAMAAAVPKILWVELTSKCPFDCIFCSRKLLRSDGEHMDFQLYRSLIRQLQSPELIRLNYSGESIHYPHLIEAIELAKSTGATSELVSAFASTPASLVERIVRSGLDRLTVSLHTLDAGQYKRIYRFGSLDTLKQNIAALRHWKARLGSETPTLDFAFVAMMSNLDQLPLLAGYAAQIGVHEIFVHPVIRRDPIPYDFPEELAARKLTVAFKSRLRDAVRAARASSAETEVIISNPGVEIEVCLSPVPRYFPSSLPAHARISTCDQNPWETAHVLANGDVVACEVHEKTTLGSLKRQTLKEIWRGENYREFRRRYVTGKMAECRECPWKAAYLPSPLKPAVLASSGGSAQLLRGWYPEEGGCIWSKPEALLVLKGGPGRKRLRIAGLLPPPFAAPVNELEVQSNGIKISHIVNTSGSLLAFDKCFDFFEPQEPALYLQLSTGSVYRPSRTGSSNDHRDLGFALSRIEVLGFS